jgi:hypothetical protein
VGDQLRDLLSVVQWLRTRDEIDADRVAVWGDSFAPVNPPERRVAVPQGIDDEPDHAEPIGAMLSLLAALFDPRVDTVLARRGLVSLRSVLDSQFVYVPHDFIVPAALTVGDLPDIATALAPAAVRIEGLVDGTNRQVRPESLQNDWHPVLRRDGHVVLEHEPTDDYVTWLVARLNRQK